MFLHLLIMCYSSLLKTTDIQSFAQESYSPWVAYKKYILHITGNEITVQGKGSFVIAAHVIHSVVQTENTLNI